MTDPQYWPQAPGAFIATAERYAAADAQARGIAAELAVTAPSDALRIAAELDRTRETFVDEYSALVDDVREAMTAVAARTSLARLEVRGTHPPGDPGAAASSDLAELRGRAETEDEAREAQRRAAELGAEHANALGGFGSMAGLGMLGRSFGVDGAHRAAHYDVPMGAPADLEQRLREVCGAVTGAARGWVRMAVADVLDEAGRSWRLIGTTELDGYLRPGVILRDGELAAGNEVWPELSIATFCAAHGYVPGPVVGTVEPPDEVSAHLRDLGFVPSWSTETASGSWEDGDAPVE